MEEALELGEYLPQSFAAAGEQAYLDFLWSAFQTNYEAERYEFASLAFHLLYMSFISFSIWQIRLARPEPFRMAMVGFQSDDEVKLMDCATPFKFYDTHCNNPAIRAPMRSAAALTSLSAAWA